jgi:predicted transcriptional regulator
MELKQGDLENLIINALWDLEGDDPSTAHRVYVSDVQEHIRTTSRKWAYTTVKTVMDRLVDKDLALRHKEGKRFYYQSLVSRSESGRQAVTKLVRQYFQGDVEGLLACVAQLRRTLGDDFATRPPERKVAPVTISSKTTTAAAALSREFQAHLIKRSYENAPAGERFVRRTPANSHAHGSSSAAPGGATAASFRAAASSYHDDVPVLIGAGRIR